jgi:hypothetical protein
MEKRAAVVKMCIQKWKIKTQINTTENLQYVLTVHKFPSCKLNQKYSYMKMEYVLWSVFIYYLLRFSPEYFLLVCCLKTYMQNYNFVYGSVWERNLVSNIKGGT